MLDFITVVKTDIDRQALLSDIDNCVMSISLRRGGLSVYITNSNNDHDYGVIECRSAVDIFTLENIDLVLSAIVEDFPDLRRVEKELFVMNSLFTFVPEPFYDEARVVEIINFAIGDIEDGYEYGVDCVGDRYALFIYPISIVNSFIRVWGDIKIRHASTLAVKRCKNEVAAGYNMGIVINESELEVLLYKDRGFRFYNVFDFTTDVDILYYVMTVINHFEVDMDCMTVELSGSRADEFNDFIHGFISV